MDRSLEFSFQNKVFSRTNDVLEKLGDELDDATLLFADYEVEAIRLRFKQLMSVYARIELMHTCAQALEHKEAQLAFTVRNGKLQFPVLKLLKNHALFLKSWVKLTCGIIGLIFRQRKTNISKATILRMGGFADLIQNEESEFIRFLKHGPIAPLRDAEQIIVHEPQLLRLKLSLDKNVHYVRDPFLFLLGAGTLKSQAHVLRRTLGSVTTYLRLCFQNPAFSLFTRDILYRPIVETLDQHGLLENYIFDNSQIYTSELFIHKHRNRAFKSALLLYSGNSRTLTFKGIVNPPAYRYFVKADKAFVWNQEQADWIAETTAIASSEIVGPIQYKLPPPTISHPTKTKLIISCFDVTPTKSTFTRSTYGHDKRLYYNVDVMIKFIDDILSAANSLGIACEVRVKPKRKYHPIHDEAYIRHVDDLVTRQALTALPSSTDIFKTLADSHVVVAIPFTSVAYLGNYMCAKSCFYDPMSIVDPVHLRDRAVSFVSGPDELKVFLRACAEGL